MGGLAKKIPNTYRTMLIGSVAIAGIPPLAGFFSKDEILGEAFKNGFQWVWLIGIVVAGHDRVLHVPAHRADVLGREPGRSGGRAEHPRVAVGDDGRRSDPGRSRRSSLGCPVLPGPPLGPLFGLHGPGLLAGWLEPVFAHGDELLGRAEAEFQIFGIDGALILGQRRRRRHRDRHRVAAVRRRARLDPLAPAPRTRPGARPPASRSSTAPRSTSGGSTTSTTSCSSVIGGRIAAFLWWFDRRVVDGTVNDVGATTVGAGTRPPPGPDRARPELRPGDRRRPDRHGRLVPRCPWRRRHEHRRPPDPHDRHVHAARRGAPHRGLAGPLRPRAGARPRAWWPGRLARCS